MQFKQFIMTFSLLFSLAGQAQILNNTFADGENVIIGQKKKENVEFNFSKGNDLTQYCVLPFKYNKGVIELPKDKNSNQIPAQCKYVTEADKKLSLNLESQYEGEKFDGVFMFNAQYASILYSCFNTNLQLGQGYGLTPEQLINACGNTLGNVHVMAFNKKRKLNKSTKEIFAKHVNNSSRFETKEDNYGYSPYAPSSMGLSTGFGGFGY